MEIILKNMTMARIIKLGEEYDERTSQIIDIRYSKMLRAGIEPARPVKVSGF
jgi:hypothetical protein